MLDGTKNKYVPQASASSLVLIKIVQITLGDRCERLFVMNFMRQIYWYRRQNRHPFYLILKNNYQAGIVSKKTSRYWWIKELIIGASFCFCQLIEVMNWFVLVLSYFSKIKRSGLCSVFFCPLMILVAIFYFIGLR